VNREFVFPERCHRNEASSRLELGQILPYITSARGQKRMPEIQRFGSFKLLMFFQDENPPHVHIKGADFAAKIRISNGELLAVMRRAGP
jgi:hypothetical protein